jgi:carbamoyl-phosphate synthase large subunit
MNAAFATVNANKADDRARVTSVQELHKRIY